VGRNVRRRRPSAKGEGRRRRGEGGGGGGGKREGEGRRWEAQELFCFPVFVQPGKLLPSAHAVEREYRVMEAVKKEGVPIPKLWSLCEDSR
jgi:hypothetical protein